MPLQRSQATRLMRTICHRGCTRQRNIPNMGLPPHSTSGGRYSLICRSAALRK